MKRKATGASEPCTGPGDEQGAGCVEETAPIDPHALACLCGSGVPLERAIALLTAAWWQARWREARDGPAS